VPLAPPRKPFQASGTIDYVLDKGGYVLDTGDGNVHALIPEILIDSGSTVHLGVLKDMKTKGVVSGKYAIVNNTERMFDKRSCITIYEQP
jgi:hypothetical protein